MTRRLATTTLLVALSHLALEFSQNFLPVVYPLLIERLELTYTQVGSMALTASVFGSLMQPVFGLLSDRWDPRRITVLSILWGGLIMGLVGIAARFAGHYWLLLPIIGLGALGSAAFHPAGASLATAGVIERRGTVLSVFSVGGNLGSALSPIIVGAGLAWFGLWGTAVVIPITLVVSLLLYRLLEDVPMPPRLTASPVTNPAPRSGIDRRSWVAIGLIIVIVAARSWFQGALITYLPEWLQTQGRSLEAAGSFLSILLLSVSIGSLTGGTLSDKVGRVPVVVVTLGLLGPAHWLFLHSSGGVQLVIAGTIGALIGSTFPVTIALAQEVLPRTVGLASALVLGLGWLPAGLGSWLIGFLADRSTLTNALTTLITVPLIGVLAAVTLSWRQSKR
jgi:FSR family fosmidomycin resistance protein-like MFS transporter